jgi:hypothetical protein
VHGFTSNGDGSNQTPKGDVVNFVPSGFVDEHNGEGDFSAGFAYGLNRF